MVGNGGRRLNPADPFATRAGFRWGKGCFAGLRVPMVDMEGATGVPRVIPASMTFQRLSALC